MASSPNYLYRWYNSFTSGKIDNGDAFSIEAQLFRGDQPLTQPPQLIPAESFQTLITGRAFIVVYLLIKYRDIFDVKHWVKFCTWDSYAAGGIFTSKACADYNSVDNN